jgi:2-isopropylmalate synthase
VELEKDGGTFHDSATGDGPCDAAFRAIDRITGLPGTVSDFSVHTVGPGTDGVAEVRIRAVFEGREFAGKCTNHSIVEAAARSYLQAANKAAYEMKRADEAATVGPGSVHKNEAVDQLFPGGY